MGCCAWEAEYELRSAFHLGHPGEQDIGGLVLLARAAQSLKGMKLRKCMQSDPVSRAFVLLSKSPTLPVGDSPTGNN